MCISPGNCPALNSRTGIWVECKYYTTSAWWRLKFFTSRPGCLMSRCVKNMHTRNSQKGKITLVTRGNQKHIVLFRIKIKIVFASYSIKAQNMTCTIWLLGYKYFVHSSGHQLSAFDVEKNGVTQYKEVTILTNSFVTSHALLFWLIRSCGCTFHPE